jgi:hypothetical protein
MQCYSIRSRAPRDILFLGNRATRRTYWSSLGGYTLCRQPSHYILYLEPERAIRSDDSQAHC